MFSDKYSVYADISGSKSKIIKIRAEKGTVTCLAGPQNSGKSKVIEVLAGLRKAEGELLIDGMKWINDEVAIKSKVSFVYDFVNFSFNATPDRIAREIMAFEKGFDYEYFSEKMEESELNKKRKIAASTKDVKALVKVILALSRRPEILIMDEPFGHIDFEYRRIIIILLKEFMQAKDHTLIFTFDTREDESRFNESDFKEYKKFLDKMKESVDEIILLDTGEVVSNGSRNESVHNDIKSDTYDKKNKILDFSQKLSRNASHNVSDKISQNVTSHNVSDKASQNEFWNTNHSKKNLSDDSIADDNEDALISVLKVKQNIIRWLNILRLYFGDGSSNVHGLRDFFRWFVIFAFASFLTGRAAGNDNYDIFLIPFVIVCSVCVISRVFENKKSLILSLGISWRQHIKNSYITSALMIVFIIAAFSFFLVFFSGGKAVSGNSIIYNGIRLNTGGMIYIIIFYIILFFMYFPLAYIAKNKIWWIYSAGVSLILYFIVYIMMTAFKLGSIYAGNGNFISRFESIPYYQWYLFGLLVICAISTRLSVRISKYFYMKI